MQLDLAINGCLTDFRDKLGQFGFKFTTQFDKGCRIEVAHSAAKDIPTLKSNFQLDMDNIQKPGEFLTLLYSYSPLRVNSDIPRNRSLDAIFLNNQKTIEDLPLFPELKPYQPDEQFPQRYLPGFYVYKDSKTERDLSDFTFDASNFADSRDVLPFELDLDLVFLSGSTDVINSLQFLLLSYFRDIDIEFDLELSYRDNSISIPLMYRIGSEILEVGFIDYTTTGTIQKLVFNAKLQGILVSPFVSQAALLEYITLHLGIKNPSVEYLKSKF